MIKRMMRWSWWLGVLVLTLALVAQYAVYRSEAPSTTAHATWKLTPANFSDVVNAADTIVTGDVESVEAGPSITIPLAGEPEGKDEVPTQRVLLRLRSVEKGNAQAGQQIVVFQTGGQRSVAKPTGGKPDESRNNPERRGEQPGGKAGKAPDSPAPPDMRRAPEPAPVQPPAEGTRIFLLPELPPYEVGATYFLALTDGPDGTKAPVHPAGRYKIQGNKAVATGDDPVSLSVRGRDLAVLVAAAQGAANIPTTAPGLQKRETTGEPGMPTTGEASESSFQPMMLFWVGMGLVLLSLGTAISGFAISRRK